MRPISGHADFDNGIRQPGFPNLAFFIDGFGGHDQLDPVTARPAGPQLPLPAGKIAVADKGLVGIDPVGICRGLFNFNASSWGAQLHCDGFRKQVVGKAHGLMIERLLRRPDNAYFNGHHVTNPQTMRDILHQPAHFQHGSRWGEGVAAFGFVDGKGRLL